MELQQARAIVETLAQGIHPVTGELMDADGPYNEPVVIRALFTVARALEGGEGKATREAGERRSGAPNQGKPWAPEDDAKLEAAFVDGADLKPLAQELGRTTFALEARLVKLGRLPPRSGMRFGTSAPA
ncbi:hypothetical protein RAMLITH_16300 [Ramlibacter sp. RBP-2]|uniref:Uncharacterized protein n=1 Tax=Ramlibacter lithotrophicus TaxID=2606681 RepID=A0A7X6DHP6_9BURK|nr:hypothetical protein [Ramlibacter lithotrophicus]NKE67385.1 hypothetical protein [Ramlibacter lithotrophicus]